MILRIWLRLIILTTLIITPPVAKAGFWEVTAHRGDRLTYRENSLSALIHAMEIGASSVEFDVHLTKDGVPIIYHDYRLKPIDFKELNDPVLIKDLTISEIQALHYSERLITRAGDNHLVTLQEFLQAVAHREKNGLKTIPLHLEIKSEKEFLLDSAPISELAFEISKVIDQIQLKTPIIARAFNWDVLTEFKKHKPEIPLVLLVDEHQWSSIDFATAIKKFNPIAFAPHHADLTPQSIAHLTRFGIDVNPWTVNSPDAADALVRMGVSGITTDHPSIFLKRYQPQLCRNFYSPKL